MRAETFVSGAFVDESAQLEAALPDQETLMAQFKVKLDEYEAKLA